MNDISTRVGNTHVRAFDWIDGKNIYLHMEQFAPGASLLKPPRKELSVLIERTADAEARMRTHLDSIVRHFMG